MKTTSGREIVDRIDQRRKELGLMRSDIAEHCGITTQSFINWGNRGSIPQADVLLAVADYLQCEPEWLMYGETARLSCDEVEIVSMLRKADPSMIVAVKSMLSAVVEKK